MNLLKQNLLNNAYNFINESILNASKAKRKPIYWSFAILNLIQGLELLTKEILRNEHEILIYENIDQKKNTVSLSQGLERLKSIVNINIDIKEEKIIKRAINYRNKITHFEYDFNKHEFKNIYIELFEFVHYFHYKHLKNELHNFIEKKFHKIEAELLSSFKNNSIIYRGVEIYKEFPSELLEMQIFNAIMIIIDGKKHFFERYKYGNAPLDKILKHEQCDDCCVSQGEYHLENCDLEECPHCGKQLLSCSCYPKNFYSVR